MTNQYEIIIYWSQKDKAFIAEAPELPGCMADETCGKLKPTLRLNTIKLRTPRFFVKRH